jgi:hypothetical protein
MSRYRNVNEILSDLENRQGLSSSHWPPDDVFEVPQSVSGGLSHTSSRIPSKMGQSQERLDDSDDWGPKIYARSGGVFIGSGNSCRFVPHGSPELKPFVVREVPWSATDWVSPESGYSYGNTARQVPRTAEEWASRYGRYTPSVPTYSTYSVIDWVSLLKILGYILGIFAILGYVAGYFLLR